MQFFLPPRIKTYLNERGLTDEVLEKNKITWDGERIVIPIFDADGMWIFNKYRRDPGIETGPKYTYDKGSTSALYGADKVALADNIIICEGEFDSLILETYGYVAVCSTGGAGTFKAEWLELMTGKTIYMCFDNDDAGQKGMMRIARMRSDVRCIPLPPEIGAHGDITDFFVKLGKTKKDFDILMKVSQALELPPEPKEPKRKRGNNGINSDRLKDAKEVRISEFLKFNRQGFTKCIFHADDTPSLHYIKSSNRVHCFGACGKSFDVLDVIMNLHNCTLPQAIEIALKK